MGKSFITKLKTDNYLIGSFDSYISESKSLIKNNSDISLEEVEDVLKSMPTSYRAAITLKNGEYIGYIGLYNIDPQNNTSSIRFEVNRNLEEKDKEEILDEFKKYLLESLNISEIKEIVYTTKDVVEVQKKEVTLKSNIILPSKFLVPGISEKTIEKFSEQYTVPKLQLPFTIVSGDRVIGIVGLTNLIWSNKRASLNIFLDKNLGSDITNELSGYIIDDYINFVHNSNIHSITFSIKQSDKNMADILGETNMNYYGQIPYSAFNEESLESNLMFQHIPYMKKEKGVFIPENRKVPFSLLETEKKELSDKIELENGFKLMSPKIFESENIDLNNVLQGHINAMQNRDSFTVPLGEDKYFLQKGNGNYGISKAFMNYTYIVLDEKNNYSGYINILRKSAKGKNVEVEIGIDPKMQHRGLGKTVISAFYDELFSIGCASVTSAVFEFNKPSIKLHEKVAELNGIRLESYYINGKLWDMNFYSKINSILEEEKGKHI